MVYNIWFDVCALMILSVILISFYLTAKIPMIQYFFFRMLAWTVYLSVLADLLGAIWDNHREVALLYFPIGVPFLIQTVYFVARVAIPAAFLLYVLSVLIIREKTTKGIMALLFPMIISEVLVFTNPIHKMIFYIDETGAYQRGEGIIWTYLIGMIYMLFAMILLIVYRKLVSTRQYLTLLSFEIFCVITVIIQGFRKDLLIEGFGSTMSILMFYLTIQQSEKVVDGSTGFLNKKVFYEVCSANFKRRIPIALMLLLFDDYDFMEKSYGINTLEKLLGKVGNYLRSFPGMTPYSLGDGKYCILASSRDTEQLESAMEVIDNRFLRGWAVDEYNVILSASCCMVHCPQDAVDFEELTELIDALSEMKKEDKKQISRVGELDLSRIHRKHKVENLVKVAVETEKLEVVYQPIYSKAEGRFTSAEALLRMRDEELGNVSPGEFIPIAERNGAILKIGSYVMDTVCRFISENELKKYGIDYIEINLSAVECLQEDLVESAMRHITKYSVNPDQINMEITETTVNTLPKRAEEKLRELRLKGFTFSLDDYGTGYSNLSRLANLPLNIVKIDKSIVQEAFTSEKMKVILDSTLQMLTQLNKKILAEGVEEKQQADYLLEHGCDYIQGYYYSRPIPAGEFLELIKGQ